MSPIYLHYLNALDVEALALIDDESLTAVEAGSRPRVAARRSSSRACI
jgi:hypothetical protein